MRPRDASRGSRGRSAPAVVRFAAAALLVWHAAAIVFAPAPPSAVAAYVEPVFSPYVVALGLDSTWSFFAPAPYAGRVLRYVVEDADGVSGELPLTEALDRGALAYFRYTALYQTVDAAHPELMKSVARRLCRRHGAIAPARIRFVILEQQRISPEAYLAGHRPLDDDRLVRETLEPVPCDG